MTTIRKSLALVGAAALMLQAHAAAAQEACVTEAEISAGLIYVMPIAIEGVSTRCASRLSPKGFFATRGPTMSARYEVLQDGAWPRARTLLMKFGSGGSKSKNAAVVEALEGVPGEALRPLVDALILQEVSKVKLQDCAKVEKILAALEPLEPGAVGNLTGAIFAVVDPKNPTICAA
jgi:hypothetical protein